MVWSWLNSSGNYHLLWIDHGRWKWEEFWRKNLYQFRLVFICSSELFLYRKHLGHKSWFRPMHNILRSWICTIWGDFLVRLVVLVLSHYGWAMPPDWIPWMGNPSHPKYDFLFTWIVGCRIPPFTVYLQGGRSWYSFWCIVQGGPKRLTVWMAEWWTHLFSRITHYWWRFDP